MKQLDSSPYYSILIPTKNRSHLVGYAIDSVLQQDFDDFEIILCDNDDDEDATRRAVEPFLKDHRVRYVRTGGLDMVQNWNRALDHASGRYVTVLEDKMIFYPGALAGIRERIERSPSGVVVWNTDVVQDSLSPPILVMFARSNDRVLDSDEVLAHMAEDMMSQWRLIPRGLSCVVPRELIERIVQVDGRPFYEPLSPDLVSGLKVLDLVDSYLYAGESYTLIVANSVSNGKRVRLREEKDNSLRYYSGGNAVSLNVSHVPVKSYEIVVNTIVNDYRALSERGFEKLCRHPVNQANYVNMMTRELVSTTLSARRIVWDWAEFRQLLGSEGGYALNAMRMLRSASSMMVGMLSRKLMKRTDPCRRAIPLSCDDLEGRIERCIEVRTA